MDGVPEDCSLLFPSRNGTPVHPNNVRRFVKREAQRAEIAEADRVSPHTLRHTAGTDFYRHRRDLRAVQRFLGHSDVSTTQLYTHLANGDVNEALEGFRSE